MAGPARPSRGRIKIRAAPFADVSHRPSIVGQLADGNFGIDRQGHHLRKITGLAEHQGQGQGRGEAQGQAQGQWTLKSVLVSGQDVTDQAVELKPGQNVDNVTIVLTDRTTEVSGTVRDAKNAPAPAITVIAFSTDQQYWRAQSRHIQAVRTDSTGTFGLRGLPPGDYFIVSVDGVEQGEWFDPTYLEQARTGAARFTVREGAKQTVDLRVKTED